MSYYIRVLAEKADIVPVATIRQWLQEKGLEDITVVVEDGDEASWNEISLRRKRRRRLVVIERNPVTPGSLGAEEIQEFLEEVSRAKPKSGADWLREYLPRVRAVYAFQLLFDISSDADWQVVHEVQGRIWETLGGILQADGEGFSNTEGYHILWQFSESVRGPWKMAVLDETGQWKRFEMDLGNLEHRKAFQEGRVPEDVTLL